MKKQLLVTLLATVTLCLTGIAQPALNWVNGLTGTNTNSITNNSNTITTDVNGNVFIAGYFIGTIDFDPGAGVSNLTAQGGYADLFVAKYAPNGNYLWAKQVRTHDAYPPNEATAVNMRLTNTGDPIITGWFDGVQDLNPGAGIDTFGTTNGLSLFLIKLDNNGNYIWAKAISAYGFPKISIDNANNIYLAGWYQGSAEDFNPGPAIDSLPRSLYTDIFIAKYDANGNFNWVKGLHSGASEVINDIVSDAAGNIYVCGNFESSVLDFDPDTSTAERYRQSLGAGTDFFIAKYTTDGSFLWANTYGHPTYINSSNTADRLRLDANNDIIVAGGISGEVDFNADAAVDTLGFASQAIGFPLYFAKYSGTNGNYIFAKALFGQSVNYVRGLGLDDAGNIYVASNFEQFCDADPGAGTDTLSTTGSSILLAEYGPTGNYIWGKLIESNGVPYVSNICVLPDGTMYTTGRVLFATDFDLTAATDSVVPNAFNYALYLAKYGDATTAINKLSANQGTSVYPNPFSNYLKLTGLENTNTATTIRLMDIAGKEIYSKAGELTTNTEINLQNSLAPGIYLLHIENGTTGLNETFKIVKQ
jgi:hypothetical protein